MRKIYVITLLSLLVNLSFGQQKIRVHNSGNTMYAKELTAVDSIKLDNTYAKFKLSDATTTLDIQKTLIDSLTFTSNNVTLDKIYIIYNGTDNATIINPYATQGVAITATAGTVVVTATSVFDNLEYNILGSSANGSLTMTTNRPVNLVLNNVTLTNPSGAAFSISGAQITTVYLTPGTTNTLSDGSTSTKNGTITTNGPIVINGSGNLNITGIKKHGINTSSTITIQSGTTTITAAASDGFHSEGYIMSGGTATITSLADGIDAGDAAIAITGGTINITSTSADVKAIKTGLNTLTITGGTFNLNVSGAQSKGISSKGNMTISGGTFAITISGATVLTASGSGFDPSHCTAIKSDAQININGGTFTIQSLAAADGGKGFSAGTEINITAGNFTISTAGNGANYTNTSGAADSYSVSGFSTNTSIAISGGTLNLTNSGTNGKGISANSNVTVSGTALLTITNAGNAGKGIKADGTITFTGGTTTLNISGTTVLTASGSGFDTSYPTGIKATVDVVVSGGTINFQGTSTALGAKGLSADQAITVTGGTISSSTAGAGANYTNVSGVVDSYSSASLSADTNITISGGTLNLTNSGANGKGISSNGNVTISGTTQTTITNSGASGKCIKTDGGVVFDGGTTTMNISGATVLTATGSGFDPSYPTGVKATTDIIINSGTITIVGTAAATGTKGLSADAGITINGGTINITAAGNGATYTNSTGVLDSYSSAAISSDTFLTINGGNITTSSSGTGGKGLKADGALTIGTLTTNPTLNITTTGARFLVSGTNYCHPKTIVAVGTVVINNGTNTINSTDDGIHSDTSVTINGGNTTVNAISTVTAMGEGVEAPIINFTGGVTNITASNDGINATYGTVSGGTESNDGSQLNISGGVVIVVGKDAIDSNGNITITGGTTIVCGPTSQPEEGIDFNGTFNMNGGLLISGGSNSSMTKAMSTTSTQRGMYLKSSTQLAATSLIHIRTATGTELATFKPKNGVYYFHFSSPNIAASTSHQVYFGGTYTGGSFVGNSSGWGLYTGGTYSTTGGTVKSTFTTSATSTVNTVTF